MEKKAKIIATIGPSISSLSTLRKIIGLGVDAFRINFSHDLTNIKKIIQQIRSLEKKTSKNVSIIGDLQGVKIRIGRFKKKNQVIKKNQFFTFDLKNKLGDKNRVTLPYPKLLKKIKKKPYYPS